LRVLPGSARDSIPVVVELRKLLPDLRRTLVALGPLAGQLVPTIEKTTNVARGFLPIFAGLRPYAPDLVAGLYNGFGGVTSGYYDANGHYARIAANFGAGALAGLGSFFPVPQVPNLVGYRTGLIARCPGAAVEPAPDGSNPWIPDPSLCDPAQSRK
jgi:phospholipid/cholesterol/gamma-HCH transport system substrate-binding protein